MKRCDRVVSSLRVSEREREKTKWKGNDHDADDDDDDRESPFGRENGA